MIKKQIKILILVLLPLMSFSQRHEVGGMIGVANYFGDLNYNRSMESVEPMANVFYRMNFDTRWALRTSISYAKLTFDDKMSKNAFNRQRNLHFRTNIIELASMLELNFLDFDKLKPKNRFSPYFTIGVSLFYFDPQAQINGKWYYLQPLGTEGQNDESYSGVKKYNVFDFAIPVGGGLKYSLTPNWSVGVSLEYRITFTDYIDDVGGVYASPLSLPEGSRGVAYILADRSAEVGHRIGEPGRQRATSERNDSFMFIGASVSYTFFRLKCPTFR